MRRGPFNTTLPPQWSFVTSDSEWPEPHMGSVVPRMPRSRPQVMPRQCRPAPKVTRPATAICQQPHQRRTMTADLCRGALIGAAMALGGVLSFYLWSM